jgi:outer membrane protein TolC
MFPRNPWERSAAVAGARSAWYAAQADLRQATVTVALDTCRAFEDLRFFTEDLALVEEVAAVRRDLVRQTDDMLKAGRLSAMEGVQARQRYLQALADCARGRQAWTDARQSLAACVGLAPAAVQLAAAELAPLDALALEVPDQDVTSAALSNRADVAALGWRSRAAHAAYREVLAARIPWFSFVQGAYASTETASDASSVSTKAASTVATVEQRTQNSDAEEWRIDAGIVLPIFSWMNGEAALRRTEYEKACVLEAQAILDVPRQVAAARDRLRTQASQMCRYAEESQVTIRELESLLAPGSPSGELAPEDAARAREELIHVRRLEVAAGHQRNAALFDLHAAMGTLPVATVELPPPAW